MTNWKSREIFGFWIPNRRYFPRFSSSKYYFPYIITVMRSFPSPLASWLFLRYYAFPDTHIYIYVHFFQSQNKKKYHAKCITTRRLYWYARVCLYILNAANFKKKLSFFFFVLIWPKRIQYAVQNTFVIRESVYRSSVCA